MQSENRILEDLARLAGGAMSSFSTLKDEAEARLHEKLEKILEHMDLVKRDEFEAVKEMAIRARTENAELAEKIKSLEAKPKSPQPGNASNATKRKKTIKASSTKGKSSTN